MKKISFLLITICSLISRASEPHRSLIIKNASYLVYEKQNNITGGVPLESQKATFYSHKGNALVTVAHNHHFRSMSKRLDPTAYKPQPTYFKIEYMRESKKNSGIIQPSGYYVIFFDKNRNAVRPAFYLGFSLPTLSQINLIASELDLSVILKTTQQY